MVHSLSVGRSSDEVLRVLEALQSGGLCPGENTSDGPLIDVLSVLGPNRVIGEFQIEAEIGSGGFGTVYRARDILLDRTVALKIPRRSELTAAEAELFFSARSAFRRPMLSNLLSSRTRARLCSGRFM